MRIRLIWNWRSAWRMFSVQAQAVALACVGAWQAAPEDLKANIPGWVPLTLLGAILIGGIIGRLIDQPKTRRVSQPQQE